ncbi:MAG: cell envelope integrity protein CreD, partial [Bacteroidetes bacterium]
MRVAKYAVLFIVLTYLIFFFVEVLNKVLIHPIQYILVGIALILFYVLLLAFSEQIFFNAAYLVSAIMTIGLIFLYCRSLLGSWALAAMTSVILVILYAFIFIIIQMQDYALLFGSIGIFMILAVTMYFSRKIDWFDLKKSQPE